jgi:thiol-disulfide isomerase/thioredoxin
VNIQSLKALWLAVLLFQTPALFAQNLVLDETYQQFQGEPIALKQQLGNKPIYLKLWATWCLDCRKQMPDLQAVYTKYKDAIDIYAVNLNINETQETLQAIKDKYQLTVPIVLDNNGTIARNFNFVGTPFHVLINADGKVVYTSYHADADLHLKLDQLAHATLMSSAKVEGVADGNHKRAAPKLPKGFAVRYFSASWCGWYFADIEPAMAQNCMRGDAVASALFKQSTSAKIDWASYATYLWAEPKDVDEYKKKQALPYAITYDRANTFAQGYRVSQYPTLIVFKNGKEVRRFTQFDQPEQLQKTLATLLQLK